MKYVLKQILKNGDLWVSSEVFEGEPHAIRQAVIAGALFGEPRWAEDERGGFLYGLDDRGCEMRLAPSRQR